MPVVLVPWVEAWQEIAKPCARDLAEHARPHPQIPQQALPRVEPGDSVLAHQLERALGSVDQEIAGDVEHHLGLHLPALEARPAACRMEPSVVSDALMLDLLDRMPAPQVRGAAVGSGEMARVGEELVGK